ncbi:hypothetical protein ACIRD3_34365 [Kitasatospora sp. NPDC093550]|uniref:hypothetical protein n=1 Tax=Kitasatospora sp. NPDC093550 TaxID=3364089 RepID=UPI00382A9262
MFSHQSVPPDGPQAVTLGKPAAVNSENAPAATVPRSRRLPLQLTVGTLGAGALAADGALGRWLVRAGMDLTQSGLICTGLLAIPAMVALAVVMWATDKLEPAPRG